MEEKKLTDEEIVKDIERSTGMPSYWKKIVLDFIHRLQAENEELKYAREVASRESKQFVEYATKVNDEQKAEIERLKRYEMSESEFQRYSAYKIIEPQIRGCLDRERELQKQMDELKSENTELYKERTTLIAGSILQKEQTIKDTAKEILTELLKEENLEIDYFTDENGDIRNRLVIRIGKIKDLAKKYCVEV